MTSSEIRVKLRKLEDKYTAAFNKMCVALSIADEQEYDELLKHAGGKCYFERESSTDIVYRKFTGVEGIAGMRKINHTSINISGLGKFPETRSGTVVFETTMSYKTYIDRLSSLKEISLADFDEVFNKAVVSNAEIREISLRQANK